jgi:hypothetical protein
LDADLWLLLGDVTDHDMVIAPLLHTLEALRGREVRTLESMPMPGSRIQGDQ